MMSACLKFLPLTIKEDTSNGSRIPIMRALFFCFAQSLQCMKGVRKQCIRLQTSPTHHAIETRTTNQMRL